MEIKFSINMDGKDMLAHHGYLYRKPKINELTVYSTKDISRVYPDREYPRYGITFPNAESYLLVDCKITLEEVGTDYKAKLHLMSNELTEAENNYLVAYFTASGQEPISFIEGIAKNYLFRSGILRYKEKPAIRFNCATFPNFSIFRLQ